MVLVPQILRPRQSEDEIRLIGELEPVLGWDLHASEDWTLDRAFRIRNLRNMCGTQVSCRSGWSGARVYIRTGWLGHIAVSNPPPQQVTLVVPWDAFQGFSPSAQNDDDYQYIEELLRLESDMALSRPQLTRQQWEAGGVE